ncbi:flagellar hook-length control protein FliK [Paucimonas lemoignei]|uniref:Flagellar hook-length control protein FliK n=1 Tax=Paucimonas lemoignei TaxID=29443 RepID=A0A4R3I314_PAULE|nr:flagellar hook-length control protein FliK [Paucimonas lemoignei]TCS39181.1 flagellar hook-length control protein FliK [Paucimonas lemoignei]
MQTPAILNISNPAAGTATTKSAGNVSNSAFNQMLSQQIADRRDSAQPRTQTPTPSPANNKTPEARPAAQTANKTDSTQGNKTEASKGSGDQEQDRTEESADAGNAQPTATQLLAEAAGALLLQQRANDGAGAADSQAGAGIRDVAADGAKRAGKADLLAVGDGADKRADGNADFMASLRDATDANAATDSARGKSLDKLTELASAKAQETPALAIPAAHMQGAQELAQLAAGKVTDHLAPRVGTPNWDQALGQKVVWMVGGAQQSASLSLNPPDLGPMQIVLNVNNGQADASFYAAQPEVRQALEAALPKLRDMMSEAGVQLGQASVSAGMPERHDQPGERSASQGNGGSAGMAGNDASQPAVTRVTQITQGQGLVDTFV